MLMLANDNEPPPDLMFMSHAELIAWAAQEPPETALDQFCLATHQGRCAFLLEYYNRGDTALFEGVSHIWQSLSAPKTVRCAGIGRRSGTGGIGKRALRLTLQKCLAECLAQIESLPERTDYGELADWHNASMLSFAMDEQRVRDVCARYAFILDGSLPLQPRKV